MDEGRSMPATLRKTPYTNEAGNKEVVVGDNHKGKLSEQNHEGGLIKNFCDRHCRVGEQKNE